jgi:hypothetical protein
MEMLLPDFTSFFFTTFTQLTFLQHLSTPYRNLQIYRVAWQLSRCLVFNLDLLQASRLLFIYYGLLISDGIHVFDLGLQHRMTGGLTNTELKIM